MTNDIDLTNRKTLMSLRDQLQQMEACPLAIEWVGDRDITTAWAECHRGDWMLWLAARVLDRPLLVRAACACAREALVHVPDGEDRPRVAIDTAEAWVCGDVELQEFRAAAGAAAEAAAEAVYAVYVAESAADADNAAAYTAAAEAAVFAANTADAADAAKAANAAACAAYAYARRKSLAESADIIRSSIPVDVIEGAMAQTATQQSVAFLRDQVR